jgi:hypothetical protein
MLSRTRMCARACSRARACELWGHGCGGACGHGFVACAVGLEEPERRLHLGELCLGEYGWRMAS